MEPIDLPYLQVREEKLSCYDSNAMIAGPRSRDFVKRWLMTDRLLHCTLPRKQAGVIRAINL